MLLNASNLHAGGGVQVASSVIGELTRVANLPINLVVWASSEVDANLRKLGYDLSLLPNYEVVNTYGIKLLFSPFARRMLEFETIFTIFGPLYLGRRPPVTITGFAQPWIIYPGNEVYRSAGWLQRLKIKLKFSLQAMFFRRSKILVVELEHVRDGLLRRRIGSASSIRVVRNCLSSLYLEPSTWKALSIASAASDLRLGFVGRNYAHKNTQIFPEIIAILSRAHGINASVYVTFTDEEWDACDEKFRSVVSNVGALFVDQCPNFYRSIDAVIFPSLLECFSATPLEAMAMQCPLFASDRPFNRDVCAEYAIYFDPLDPADAAAKIAGYVHDASQRSTQLKAAREHALSFSNAKDRAEKYLDIFISAAGKNQII